MTAPRKPWGVYRNATGVFNPVFVHFSEPEDGELVDAYPTRPEAKAEAAERNRLAFEAAAKAMKQGVLFP